MRTAGTSFLLAAAVLAVPGTSAAAQDLAVTYQMMSDRGEGTMTQMYKGGQVRTEMAGQGHQMVMLMDGAGKKMTMIMPEQKMYMSMDMSQMAAMGQGHEQEHGPPKITDLGTSETIAGHKCSNYLVGDEQDMEVCAATGMGFFVAARNPMGRGGPTSSLEGLGGGEFSAKFKDGFFPLRVSRVAGGKKHVMIEATKVEQKALDASLFTVPAGYNEMRMPGRP